MLPETILAKWDMYSCRHFIPMQDIAPMLQAILDDYSKTDNFHLSRNAHSLLLSVAQKMCLLRSNVESLNATLQRLQ